MEEDSLTMSVAKNDTSSVAFNESTDLIIGGRKSGNKIGVEKPV